jgi:hypothetical protein
MLRKLKNKNNLLCSFGDFGVRGVEVGIGIE